MIEQRPTLSKVERLKSRQEITSLFQSGLSLYKYPLKFIYSIKQDQNSNVRVAFTAPKRSFKKAVDRNLLKRRMRESYRLQKHVLSNSELLKHNSIDILMIYTGKKIVPSSLIFSTMEEMLTSISVGSENQ